MNVFMQINLMAHGASLSLFALWSWILWRDHRNTLAARVGIAMNISIVGYILATATWDFRPGTSRFMFSILASATPGLFWLFARTWFNDKLRLEPWAVSLVAVSVINLVILQLSVGNSPLITLVAGIVFRLGMFAFAIAGLWEAWRGRDGDLVEARRRLRPGIIAAVGVYVILIAIVEVAVFNFAAPIWIARLVGSSISVITLLFCVAMFGMRRSDLFGPAKKMSNSQRPPAATDGLTARLLALMQDELPHRDETMTIAKLASQLGEQEYRLRRHINGALGHRNFASFLNSYRLSEVKAALADVSQKDVPIITIALDAGFGSLGPFNRAFREAEGMTPSEYRARNTS